MNRLHVASKTWNMYTAYIRQYSVTQICEVFVLPTHSPLENTVINKQFKGARQHTGIQKYTFIKSLFIKQCSSSGNPNELGKLNVYLQLTSGRTAHKSNGKPRTRDAQQGSPRRGRGLPPSRESAKTRG